MGNLPYHEMAASDLWPICFSESTYSRGERNSLEVLLFHPESINQIGIGIIPGDLKFTEYFDLDKKATKKTIDEAFNDYFIAAGIDNFVKELFSLIDKAIRAGKLDSSVSVEGVRSVEPVRFLRWLEKREYFVPLGLIESLENGKIKEAEYLLQVFRQGILYQFICWRSHITKRDSSCQLKDAFKETRPTADKTGIPRIAGPYTKRTRTNALRRKFNSIAKRLSQPKGKPRIKPSLKSILYDTEWQYALEDSGLSNKELPVEKTLSNWLSDFNNGTPPPKN